MALIGKNLSFAYKKGETVFSKLDISIGKGEVIGLQGYSGSGKTTLGKVLAAYFPSSSGRVEIDAEPAKFRHGEFFPVQMIHQHPEKSLNPRLKMHKILSEAQIDREEMMTLFEIQKEWLERRPFELSGGELQRFCIARAFDERTKYLIADEITTMLDGITQAELWLKITDLCKKRNMGLMIISHEAELLKKLCDKVIDFERFKS